MHEYTNPVGEGVLHFHGGKHRDAANKFVMPRGGQEGVRATAPKAVFNKIYKNKKYILIKENENINIYNHSRK